MLIIISGCGPASDGCRNFLRLRLKEDPSTLDPAYIVDVSGGALAAKIFNGLVRFDRDGKIIPDLATGWDVSADGKTYRFYLRKGVVFNNGREVKAEDFVYSFRRLLSLEINSPRALLLEGIRGARRFSAGKSPKLDGIRAVGEREVVIELEEPDSLFLNYLAMPCASVIPSEEVEKWGRSFSDHPVGTGPFSLESWEHNNRIVLVRNPVYFAGPAELDGIVYRIIPEALTAAAEFDQGNLDIMEIPGAQYRRYTSELPERNWVRERVGLNIYYLGFNCEKYPFSDPRFRQACNYALDREKIIKVLLDGRAEIASGPVPPALLPPPAEPRYSYQPEKARKLLRQLNLEFPVRLKMLFKADREVLSVAEVIQDYLKKIGIEVILEQLEWSSFKEAVNKGEFDIFYLSWWGDYPHARNFLFPTFATINRGPGGNRTFFSDREVDRLLARAEETRDPAAGRAYLLQARDRVIELAPWVFLWHKKEAVIRRPKVKNYKIPLIYNGDKFHQIELRED